MRREYIRTWILYITFVNSYIIYFYEQDKRFFFCSKNVWVCQTENAIAIVNNVSMHNKNNGKQIKLKMFIVE